MKPTIGFIGLGIMGKPMSRNLLKAGYPLRVYSRTQADVEAIANEGAQACTCCREVAAQADVVITMLPDSPDVEQVYLGPEGILAGARAGTVLVDMSTISPTVAQKVAAAAAEKGCPMLDAPVSGGDVGAQKGTLSIMVGGSAEAFARVEPVFLAMGKPVHCGDSGAGQVVKACNQVLVAVTLLGMSEALVLGAKAGVDPAKIVQVLSGGLARCGVLEVRGPRVVERDFRPGFRLGLHYKDLNIIREAGRAFGVPLPASALAHELFGAALAAGRGNLDHSAVITILEELARAEVKGE